MQNKIGGRGLLVGSQCGLGQIVRWHAPRAWAAKRTLTIPLAKIPAVSSVGGSASVKVNGEPLLLVRDSPTSVRALSPICTHRRCVVTFDPSDNRIKCPCHGSQFDLDGRVLGGPASSPLPTYSAELSGEHVVVTT